MKFVFILALSALFLGIFGCASIPRDLPAPPMGEGGNDYFPNFDEGASGGSARNNASQESGQAEAGSQENQETGIQAGEGTGTPEGGAQYDIPSAQETGFQEGNAGSQSSKTKYIAYASLFQYDSKSREKMADKIEKGYAMEVDISEVSSSLGIGKPLQDPKKAAIKLTGPSTDITLKQGPISQAEYDSLPVSAAWPVSPYPDPFKSQFFTSNGNALLPGGSYRLTIDADGDGQIDGEKEFLIPGVQISNPTFHSRQPELGFQIQWSLSGKPEETTYTVSTGRGFAGLDNYLVQNEKLASTTIQVTPESLDGNANYLLNFQADTLDYADAQDYAMGKSQKKLAFLLVGAKEAHFILYNVGEFCHCSDAFMDRPCTVQEVTADPLCN